MYTINTDTIIPQYPLEPDTLPGNKNFSNPDGKLHHEQGAG